jgi:predicted small lipoprotein YifL
LFVQSFIFVSFIMKKSVLLAALLAAFALTACGKKEEAAAPVEAPAAAAPAPATEAPAAAPAPATEAPAAAPAAEPAKQ